MRSILGMIGVGCLLLASTAHADPLVVDRGLPTANLNNAAGANRSNVSWAVGGGYFIGDTFTLSGTAATTYTISDIQTWVVARDGAPLSATLFTGIGATADLTAASSTPTFTLVTYADGSSYQAPSGAFRSIYQVDFSGLNIVAAGGTTISFGVDGIQAPGGYSFFNLASNAALSGSPQASADNVMSYYYHDGAGADYYGPLDSNGNGFDKSSDINVRVFASATTASAVPEAATWAMMLVGFGVVGFGMRRQVRRSEVTFDAKIKRIADGAVA